LNVKEYRVSNDFEHIDLNIIYCGSEQCAPKHSWGPGIRLNYLIHYIISGKGIFKLNNQTYHLQSGQGFLIPPNTLTYYEADSNDPWYYCWIGFQGLSAESYLKQANLDIHNPIFTYDQDDAVKNCFFNMLSTQKNYTKSHALYLISQLYYFLSILIHMEEQKNTMLKKINNKELYVKKAVELIQTKYSEKLTIIDIAKHVGLDRSYLCSVFKEYLGISPQKYLLNYRINKACDILKSTHISVGDVARSVGYQDPLMFSKMFKKIKGVSPSMYAKEL